ncbi:MAG: CoA activase [Deltaproteobacteria bacterium]|nr:CoA activase [Deltaproteobacteria bacterium]
MRYLGLDMGSVSLSAVELSPEGEILASAYALHAGRPRERLCEMLASLSVSGPCRVGLTSSAPGFLRASARFDDLVSQIRAASALHPGLGALLVVGAERFSLSRFARGRYRDSRFNSLCAAGTGSFLGQQARRLGLDGAAELSRIALANEGELPRIATRCAVFAKTDLIHAQQEGYGLEAICDGLCRGLAANVIDTLFTGDPVGDPIVFAGGVALNRAVVGHMESLLDRGLLADAHAPLYGAIGAGLGLVEAARAGEPVETLELEKPADLLGGRVDRERSFYPPLALSLGDYPDFDGARSYAYSPVEVEGCPDVEVDVYRRPPPGSRLALFLGIDIGSTSTKAVLLGERGEGDGVWAGFYTRTAGRPLLAIRGIFEAICRWRDEAGISIELRAAGTTGSGRKFAGAILGADGIVDEITAHARAAYELDPEVDTIIEIGGQDAKFTTLRDGAVTQCFMNHVCAAGTGSFIEEQAASLGCGLGEVSERAQGQSAPLASDRCTVFMERDIHQLLTDGCSVPAVLASVLHSVRENYLRKVAPEGLIGQRICFQGATAKNRSLVAAFEQRLGRPIRVSRYCHLTGALGVALMLRGQAPRETRFRGLDLYRQAIQVRSEVCDLCRNHCKLRIAEIGGETVAYGFLCGREYQERRRVPLDAGADLLARRRRHFAFKPQPARRDVCIGLPAALVMVEEMPLWKKFFDLLGVRTVTSERLDDAVSKGKRLAGAEFCAPVAAFHAHVASLADRADFLFVPFYLEHEHEPRRRRQFCYYTQYAPALIGTMQIPGLASKIISPLLHIGERRFAGWSRLYEVLRPHLAGLDFFELVLAYQRAERFWLERLASLPGRIPADGVQGDDVAVMLLGRPYTVLSADMNKGIPEIFARLGVETYYQDMLDGPLDGGQSAELIRRVHWSYAARILAAAERVSRMPGLYPVIVTSFMCTPDACTLEFCRRLFDRHCKPYLILQLDEHDSQVGYETRIEAAVRAFRNHLSGAGRRERRSELPTVPRVTREADGRTLLVPRWDSFASPLFVANLQRFGIDARLLHEDELLIQKSLQHNTGQCVPLSVIVQDFIDSVERDGLDPGRCALWMPNSSIGCNIGFFPEYAKALLESYGGGFEHAAAYAGEITALEVSVRAALQTFFVFLFAGMLRRMMCRVRPYERRPGESDCAAAESLAIFEQVFLGKRPKLDAVRDVVERFLAIDIQPGTRPKVAIFGDLYVRDNDVINQDLIRCIERHGGEAVTTPYSDYLRLIAGPYLRKWLREGNYADVIKSAPLAALVDQLERPFRREFERVLGPDPRPRRKRTPEEILGRFGVRMHHTGESFDNLIKVFHLADCHPDLALFVQANPAFCCPSLVTEAMAAEIERQTGVPVVTVTYDGTLNDKNEVIAPYLELDRAR